MPVINDKYNPQKINKLKLLLLKGQEFDTPVDYEIYVNGAKIVKRTNKIEAFDLHEDFIDADTKSVEVIFYRGSSNHNERHILSLKDEPKESSLNGFDLDAMVQDGIAKEKQKMELENLKTENSDLKEEISDLEEEIDKLEDTVRDLKAKQSPLNSVFGELGATFVESFIRKNPKILAALPGGESLAGLLENPEPADENLEGLPDSDRQVSFVPVEEPGKQLQSASEFSEDDKACIIFVRQLYAQFDEMQFNNIVKILNIFGTNTKYIDEVLNTLATKN